MEQEVKDVLKQIPFAKKLLAIKGISEISLAGILDEAGDLSGFSNGNSLLWHTGLLTLTLQSRVMKSCE